MNCRQVHELIEAYHEGALPVADERGVDIHLVQCPDCNEHLGGVGRLIEVCQEALHEPCGTPDLSELRAGISELDRKAAEQTRRRQRLNRKDALLAFSVALVVIPAIWMFGLAIAHTYTVVTDWEPGPPTMVNSVGTNDESLSYPSLLD